MKKLSCRGQRGLVCLFFAAVLLMGLMTAGDYGRPWDESDEMAILRMNLWEYSRMLHLDETVFEAWAGQNDDLISALTPISESIEQDHGIAAFYPLSELVLNTRLTEHYRMLVWHMYCWALFTLGLFALYACCRQLEMSRLAGLLCALFMLLSPRFFAEGHYNNKDIVLMSLSLCVLWQGLRLMKKPTWLRALGFALAGALAANTKVVGFALWALCALFVLLRQLMQKKLDRRVAFIGCGTLVGFLGLYALLTPALWHDPLGFLSYLLNNALAFGRWENYVRFRGTTFLLIDQRLPWYYLPYMILATTPLWALLFIGLGQLTAGRALVRQRKQLWRSDRLLGLGLCSLMWLVPLLFAIVTRTTVYNGWRHFYFIYGFMLILAVYGLHTLLHALKDAKPARRVLCGLLGLCMALTGVGIVTQHPYQYAYYQPLIALKADEDYLELDYWNLSVMDALKELAASQPGTLSIGYADIWAQAGLMRTLPAMKPEIASRFQLTDEADTAAYILSNPTYALFSGYQPSSDLREAVVINAYGKPIMRIYENTMIMEERQ